MDYDIQIQFGGKNGESITVYPITKVINVLLEKDNNTLTLDKWIEEVNNNIKKLADLGTSTTNMLLTNHIILDKKTNSIPILGGAIKTFNKEKDFLFVNKNTTWLNLNEHYKYSEDGLSLVSLGIDWDIPCSFTLIAMKNVEKLERNFDGVLLLDGSVGESKLNKTILDKLNKVDKLEQSINTANEAIGKLGTALNDSSKKIDGVSKMVDSLNVKTDDTNKSIDNVATNLNNVTKSIDGLTKDMTTVKADIPDIKTKLVTLDKTNDISNINQKISDITDKNTAISKDVSDLKTKVDNFKPPAVDTGAIDKKINDIGTKVGDLSKLKTMEKGSVIGAMNELFQDANDSLVDWVSNKKALRNIVGYDDQSTTLQKSVDDLKAMALGFSTILGTQDTNFEQLTRTLGEICMNFQEELEKKGIKFDGSNISDTNLTKLVSRISEIRIK